MKGKRLQLLLSGLVILGLGGSAGAALSIYDVQYTTDPSGA